MKEKIHFIFSLFLVLFIFSDYFLSFFPFSISSRLFFYSIPFNIFSFVSQSFFKSYSSETLFLMFFLFVILFFSLISLSGFIQYLQTFLFDPFEISFRSFVVISFTFPIYLYPLYLFCVYNFSELLFPFFFFFLYSILLKHAPILTERFGQTCMTKERSEMLIMLMTHPFARPLHADRNHVFCATWFWHWKSILFLFGDAWSLQLIIGVKWKEMNWTL